MAKEARRKVSRRAKKSTKRRKRAVAKRARASSSRRTSSARRLRSRSARRTTTRRAVRKAATAQARPAEAGPQARREEGRSQARRALLDAPAGSRAAVGSRPPRSIAPCAARRRLRPDAPVVARHGPPSIGSQNGPRGARGQHPASQRHVAGDHRRRRRRGLGKRVFQRRRSARRRQPHARSGRSWTISARRSAWSIRTTRNYRAATRS